eukprot:CAMPEP_0119537960 /NCGR_PEP_ID=MMETSP1344-20130328/50505_1 /TAXON_ID=236787 /ORGANISM="Florenciella parvula, Strain CCMP2471" /LENGTH=69 /DNA_ID=CAMNT_0007580667 /DNA_START=169 /DNA_END=374 /DNA_ORIENTATION=-
MACVEKSRGTIGMSRSLFIAAILAAVTAVTASTPTPLPTPAPTSEAVMMSVYTVQYGGFILTENGGAFA